MNKLSSSDRSSLIRLASSLPAGDQTRKAILAGLAKTSGMSSSQIKSKLKNPLRLDEGHGLNKAYFDKSSGKVYLHMMTVAEGAGDEDLVLETAGTFESTKEFLKFLDSEEGDYSLSDNPAWKEVWSGDPADLE